MTGRVFLAVAGNIGSGKTTLTRRLGQRLGLTALYEETDDNPYLADFYADMSRWAMALQLRFLAGRVAKTRALLDHGVSAIQDRTCYEDADIFAANLHHRGDMDARDWETYSLIAEQLLDGLAAPDLLVYLRRSPESCRRLIGTRGRDYEAAIPMDYLRDLGARYDAWFDGYRRGPKLRVDAEAHDFLHDDADLDALVSRIVSELPQRPLPFG
ncbi:MAG TPA: deoxynucleoside kinase [Sandaracinaceae bacterium LLY-WYZ-13_1]|nr:deoxynucleoside kinase [Sandaracinaceae bacterium LLY-WYZ-13_1]